MSVHIAGRIVNPTAIFCSNRDEYYHYLSRADEYTQEGLEAWCEYVLSGLLKEIKKVDQLCDYEFLQSKILLPAINDAATLGKLTEEEARVLRVVTRAQVVKRSDIVHLFSSTSSTTVSRKIAAMVDAHLLMPESEQARKYVLSFANRGIRSSITKMLAAHDFLPQNL